MELNDLPLAEATGQRANYAITRHPRGAADPRLSHPDVLFGVEIELERFRDVRDNLDNVLQQGWVEHQEGSLVQGREFVMHPPRNGNAALVAIDTFFGSGFRYEASDRASVHIHVDMTDNTTIGQLRSVLALVYMLEGPIYRLADENRKWGSYSCPLTDMGPDRFLGLFAGKTKGEVAKAFAGNYHEEKYYGCNTVSLRKHGTLEFRYFPCTTDKDTLMLWVNLCLELKKAGMTFADPSKLYEEVNNEEKLVEFLKKYMPLSGPALLPYLDAADSHERILSVHAVSNDKNVTKVPRVGENRSPAIKRFLDAKRGIKKAPEPVAEEMPIGDLYDILQRQQRQVAKGEQLLAVGAVRKRAAPFPGIIPQGWDEAPVAQRIVVDDGEF